MVHGFSTRSGGVSEIAGASRAGGDLNLGFTDRDAPEAVLLNRERFLKAIAAAPLERDARWGW